MSTEIPASMPTPAFSSGVAPSGLQPTPAKMSARKSKYTEEMDIVAPQGAFPDAEQASLLSCSSVQTADGAGLSRPPSPTNSWLSKDIEVPVQPPKFNAVKQAVASHLAAAMAFAGGLGLSLVSAARTGAALVCSGLKAAYAALKSGMQDLGALFNTRHHVKTVEVVTHVTYADWWEQVEARNPEGAVFF